MTTDDGRRRRTDDGPLVYYKLTLWALGSDELKMSLVTRKPVFGISDPVKLKPAGLATEAS